MEDKRAPSAGSFDIAAIAASLPASASTLLVDRYLTDRPSASARVFRVYRPTPPHYHAQCDEYLYVFSGRGTFWMGDASRKAEFGPGEFCISSAVPCTRCPISSKSRSSFCRSTRRAAIQRT